jgi:hypothetical protein
LENNENPRFYGQNKLVFLAPYLLAIGQLKPLATCRSSSKKYKKNECRIHFEQKFAMVTYGVGI